VHGLQSRSVNEGQRLAHERALADLLQLAYSGELAAAHAYHGHWRSLRSAEQSARIREIEAEELEHRRGVGAMLSALGVEPRRASEWRANCIGRVLGALCHVSGWLAPMYGAGRLESHNIKEYEQAARLARDCGRGEWVDELLTMAEVEWEHERYFRELVEQHWLGRRIPLWPRPAPRQSIRAGWAESSSSHLDGARAEV